MPEIPPAAVTAAAAAIERELMSGRDYSMAADSDEALARVALEAAAPLLAEGIAQKILAHMEQFGPRHPDGTLEPVTGTGRAYRTWRRHFGIAARIASGAFFSDEDKLRLAAEAIERGEFIGCNAPGRGTARDAPDHRNLNRDEGKPVRSNGSDKRG